MFFRMICIVWNQYRVHMIPTQIIWITYGIVKLCIELSVESAQTKTNQ